MSARTISAIEALFWKVESTQTEEKAGPARAAGPDEVILYSETDFETKVKRITGVAGVNAAYDSFGKTTFDMSIECLQRPVYMVLYSSASGLIAHLNKITLVRRFHCF